jgi:hypothetical protein
VSYQRQADDWLFPVQLENYRFSDNENCSVFRSVTWKMNTPGNLFTLRAVVAQLV